MRAPVPGKPDVRDRVLRAALAAAAEAAPGPVRVAEIASRAQMSAGHVMYYFRSRDRIVIETLLHAEKDLATRRDRQRRPGQDPRELLAALVRMYLPTGRLDARWKLWAQLLASPPRDPATLSGFTTLIDSWSEAMAQAVGDGVAAGLFECADPDDFGYRACRLMDGYALEVLLGGRGRSRAWAVSAVLTALGAELRCSLAA